MLNASTIKSLMGIGFGISELGPINSEEKAKAVQDMHNEGFSKQDILDYVKATAQSTKSKSSAKVETNPEHVLETSDGVLNAEVNFGGMTTAKFIPMDDGAIALVNAGTGRRANSLFVLLGKGGKIAPVEALAKIETAEKVLKQHETVLETVKVYLTKKAQDLGALPK